VRFPGTPALTVDAVIRDAAGRTVLIRRKNPPFEGRWALPGGFVEVGETTEAACAREAMEETGLQVEIVGLAGVYSDPKRDPRGHTVAVVYLCRPLGGALAGGDDAAQARWFTPREIASLELAFDHAKILAGTAQRDYR
jgi:8-oxo-dGTP diphosphatase